MALREKINYGGDWITKNLGDLFLGIVVIALFGGMILQGRKNKR